MENRCTSITLKTLFPDAINSLRLCISNQPPGPDSLTRHDQVIGMTTSLVAGTGGAGGTLYGLTTTWYGGPGFEIWNGLQGMHTIPAYLLFLLANAAIPMGSFFVAAVLAGTIYVLCRATCRLPVNPEEQTLVVTDPPSPEQQTLVVTDP